MTPAQPLIAFVAFASPLPAGAAGSPNGKRGQGDDAREPRNGPGAEPRPVRGPACDEAITSISPRGVAGPASSDDLATGVWPAAKLAPPARPARGSSPDLRRR